jgi:hypothetical protein
VFYKGSPPNKKYSQRKSRCSGEEVAFQVENGLGTILDIYLMLHHMT